MKDRLIELLSKCFEEQYDKRRIISTKFTADFLIENGVIVPPCKVGDIVYHINTFSPRNPIIKECEVDALHITSGKNKRGHKKPSYVLVRDIMMQSLSTRIYFEEFGKTLFLTKQSAEQALKEREQNDR